MTRSAKSKPPSRAGPRYRNDLKIRGPEGSLVGVPFPQQWLRGVVLNVSYRTRELMDICTRIEEAQDHFGPQPAAELHELLAEAESFLTADELIEFRGGEILEGDSLSFSFGTHYRAAFNAVGENLPREENGSVAWGQVRRIMLIEISQ